MPVCHWAEGEAAMHSSNLRGDDFKMTWRGEPVRHAEFFSSFRDTERVGILCPRRTEGIGAITLIISYVTAFYDRYRERGADFYAYPDFFTFQRETPCADYGMVDIWPYHKNVPVPRDAQQTAEAITDRGVNVLLVPDGKEQEVEIGRIELESARRNIRRCFAYSESGEMDSFDLSLECDSDPLREYAMAVLDSLPSGNEISELRALWSERFAGGTVRQFFREMELGEALSRI